LRVRGELALDEAADRLAQLLVLVAERGRRAALCGLGRVAHSIV
jgi:hypothetical protein